MLMREMLAPYTEIVLRHDLFEGISVDALPGLVQTLGGEIKHYAAGQSIMRMGRAPIVTGVILAGAIEVSFLNENADQIDMNVFEAGQSFGRTGQTHPQRSSVRRADRSGTSGRLYCRPSVRENDNRRPSESKTNCLVYFQTACCR